MPAKSTHAGCVSLFSQYCEAISSQLKINKGFPGSSAGKESACNAGDPGSIPGLGRSPGEGNSYPLQYSGLENSMDCIFNLIFCICNLIFQLKINKFGGKKKKNNCLSFSMRAQYCFLISPDR